ncbi:hypothetical protein HC766_04820 [Candidatus Gracilibacteria bacterium]|nr:hypothetical protein [Candidatus Gracilibacteria bacterium]
MQKQEYKNFLVSLTLGGIYTTSLMLSRDLLVDKNNSIYLLLVIVPMFITWSITGGFLLQEKLNTK